VKLYSSPTSPFVRKVLATAITRGIDDRIEQVPTNPHLSPPGLVADNPLSKVPCLVTDDGLALFDSPVICEYLDSLGDAAPLFPPGGAARWRALKLQALGDGILDAAVLRRLESPKSDDSGRRALIERQQATVRRGLDHLEAEPPARHVDIGSLTIACALGYLDFRFGAEPWRESHPRLAHWFSSFSAEPGIARTVPKDPA
jgi:glutathione S-transferase